MEDEISILDKILGREKLKNKISEKESKIEDLKQEINIRERRIKSLEEDRSEALTEKQSAYMERNKLQDKVEQLNDRLEKIQNDDSDNDVSVGEVLDLQQKSNIDEFVDQISKIKYNSKVAHTVSFTENSSELSEYENFDAKMLRDVLPIIVFRDSVGLIRTAVSTPFSPDKFEKVGRSFQLNENLFKPTGNLVFGVVRSDLFVVGVYDGWELEESDYIKSKVNSSHSKGGFSQSRFDRRREEQIDEHIKKSKSLLADFSSKKTRKILVGDERILSSFDGLVDHTFTSDATGDPNEALRDAFNDFWSLKVYTQI